jgi:KaiC/GvpD/RAD55 family RecA-like ATPase
MAGNSRIKTGIPGLDKLLNGGIPNGNIVLVSGGCGTGKTNFALHFIKEGLKNGEKCLYVTTEEQPERIKKAARTFWKDIEKVNIDIKHIFPSKQNLKEEFSRAFGTGVVLRNELKEAKYDRIVIDSISTFTSFLEKKGDVRLGIHTIFEMLRATGATCLVTAELQEGGEAFSRDGISEFIADGVILLYFTGVAGEEARSLQIRKMRLTGHEKGFAPFDLSDKGITINIEDIQGVLMK